MVIAPCAPPSVMPMPLWLESDRLFGSVGSWLTVMNVCV
jgi:hypothetical protein